MEAACPGLSGVSPTTQSPAWPSDDAEAEGNPLDTRRIVPISPRTRSSGRSVVVTRAIPAAAGDTTVQGAPALPTMPTRAWSPRVALAWTTTAAPRTRRASVAGRLLPAPRGWSKLVGLDPARHYLLPAPAGLVPPTSSPVSVPSPAPRIRGDGPVGPAIRRHMRHCSPRPRGWPRRQRLHPRS